MAPKKTTGQVYTPDNIVRQILYKVNFYDENRTGEILHKHIIDNSCGDGAILVEVVKQIIISAVYIFKENRYAKIKECLETYVHGIEIDESAWLACIRNLDDVAKSFGIADVKWDIRLGDALNIHDYDGKMNFVVGNPPYVRVHNLVSDHIKEYAFANGGMTDLYLAFFELGFRMMNETGQMVYISPSSWFTSKAGKNLRDYIVTNKNLVSILDFEHKQWFDGAQTYTAISHFDNAKQHNTVMVEKTDNTGYIKERTIIGYDEFNIDGKFFFADDISLNRLRDVVDFWKKLPKEKRIFEVKNGFATLADDVFICDIIPTPEPEYNFKNPENGKKSIKLKHLIHVIKASTGKEKLCIFPYNEEGKLVSEDTIKEELQSLYQHLLDNKERLLKRKTTEPWYAFGRTQAINDTYKTKFAISSLVKEDYPPKVCPADPGVGVFGGLYVLPKDERITYEFVDFVLGTHQFFQYVKTLAKYKSGGYYTFSSKDVEMYLNYYWYNLIEVLNLPFAITFRSQQKNASPTTLECLPPHIDSTI